MRSRVYLDWNATAPLRPEARDAMVAALEVAGNPSSVHAEGRAAKAVMEKARGQVAAAIGCLPDEVVFTSGSTEAAQTVLAQGWDAALCSPVEHDAVAARAEPLLADPYTNAPTMGRDGVFCAEFVSGFGVGPLLEAKGRDRLRPARALLAVTAANSETGVIQPYQAAFAEFRGETEVAHRFCDATQAFGKIAFSFSWAECEYACVSSHKIGGPNGVGALIVKRGTDLDPLIRGGGQEMGRRSGTENVAGIAGFGAAAEAAARDLADGVWERVEKLRRILELGIEAAAPEAILVGKDASRLPNTICFAVPGWKGETQVMQMDLAGFAVSAGSACSSGKVRASRVLRAMGHDDAVASSAIRVSLGPATTEEDIGRFIDAWTAQRAKRRTRAA